MTASLTQEPLAAAGPRHMPEAEWRPLEAAHHARVDRLTAAHLERRRRGEKHAVLDFLFDYYGFTPAKLRRWHPGAGVALLGAADDPRAGWKFMRAVSTGGAGTPNPAVDEPALDLSRTTGQIERRLAAAAAASPGTAAEPDSAATAAPRSATAARAASAAVELDTAAFLAARGKAVAFVRTLTERTLERPMQTGCFGLHEWAMVYRQPAERRHGSWPLRLGAAGTDAVVEATTLRCTHFDATRFFTPEGAARNTLAPARDTMVEFEQPGCVHAGMDVYRWAFKLAPAAPSDLIVDAFELAVELRTLDMQASPYDLTGLGYEPVAIETPAGKREYAERQRHLGERANALRRRLLTALDTLDQGAAPTGRGAAQSSS